MHPGGEERAIPFVLLGERRVGPRDPDGVEAERAGAGAHETIDVGRRVGGPNRGHNALIERSATELIEGLA